MALTRFVGIVRAEALGENVVNAGRFAHGTHRGAGDHARTRAGRHQHHVGGAEAGLRPRAGSCRRRAAPSTMLRVPSLTAFSTLGGTSLALP